MAPPTPETAAERARLLNAFRTGAGATDMLSVQAVDVLRRSWAKDMAELATDDLLAELLQSHSIFPVWLERRMTALRRRFLFTPLGPDMTHLLSRLAIQCHLNEYAWAEDAAEKDLVARYIDSMAELTPDQAMTLACYRPLASLPGADALLARGWDGPVLDVLREQITAVREEKEIAALLPALTAIRGGASSDVRDQYEVNPYPRWRRAHGGALLTNIQGRPLPARIQLLIAGCGTGRHAIDATRLIPGSNTLAIDLSRTSLAYAVRKTREMGLWDRITYAQADILEFADSGRTFDMVQSTGVLHHMDDPFEGVRAVTRLLKPGGFLALGFYSAIARKNLAPAKALGRSYTPETVREFRQAVIAWPEDNASRRQVLASRDFYATSGCRDLLMHVQEHQMCIADLQRMMDENDLEFLGFHQFHQVKDRYLAMFPHDPKGFDLEAWDAFEAANPYTFARMYQFWAQKRA